MVRGILLAVFSLLAILLQAAAVMALGGMLEGPDPMLAFVALQALASLALALVAGSVIRREYYKTTRWLYLYVFSISLFMPVVGMLVFFFLWLMISVFGYNILPLASASRVEPPAFVAKLVRDMGYDGGSRIRERLQSPSSSDDERMAAMAALKSMPIHLSEKVLRSLLGDQKEELRLLAYGLIDSAEKDIMEKIARKQQKLQQKDLSEPEQGRLHATLAQLYWELVYQHLVVGDVYQYVVERVMEHARFAVSVDPGEGMMWYLLARCSLLQQQPQQATNYLKHAREQEFPRERLLPWQAEAAFQQKNYDEVRRRLAGVDYSLAATRLQPAIRYWTT